MSEPARKSWFSLRVVLLLAVVAGLVFVFAGGVTPPRLAWGFQVRNTSGPKGHRAYLVYGDSILDDLRVALSKSRTVYVLDPQYTSAGSRWPRLSGRKRQAPVGKGDEEIEFRGP